MIRPALERSGGRITQPARCLSDTQFRHPAGTNRIWHEDARWVNAGIVKRSVMIAGHRTSVSLETPFWDALRAIAETRGQSIQALIGAIDAGREGQNLSSAIRVFVLAQVRRAGS